MLFPSICSSALAEGITLCLRSAYCLQDVLLEEVFVQGFISAQSDLQSLLFCAWFQSCWHRMVLFVWRPAKARACFPFWGAPLAAGHHWSHPHPIQLREALPEVIQASMTVPVDSWRGLHFIQQHLACCCHFHCPHFLCCLKKWSHCKSELKHL